MLDQGAEGHLEQPVPMIEIANGSNRGFLMAVQIIHGQGRIAVDMASGAQLGLGGQVLHVPLHSGLILHLLKQLELILNQIIADNLHGRAGEFGHIRRVILPVQGRIAAVIAHTGQTHIVFLHRLFAVGQIGAIGHHGKEVFAVHRGDSCPQQHVCVAGRVHHHTGLIELTARLAVHDQSFTMAVLHNRLGNHGVVKNLHAAGMKQVYQCQSKHADGVAGDVAVGGRMIRLAVFPLVRQGIKAVADRQPQQFLGHALDDLLAPAIAQGHPEVDETDGRQSAQRRVFLQKQGAFAQPRGGKRRRHAGNAAARHDHVIFSHCRDGLAPLDGGNR